MTERIQPKVGRPPKRAEGGVTSTLTMRLPADIKNLIIAQASAYDLTMTEYITALVQRDAS